MTVGERRQRENKLADLSYSRGTTSNDSSIKCAKKKQRGGRVLRRDNGISFYRFFIVDEIMVKKSKKSCINSYKKWFIAIKVASSLIS